MDASLELPDGGRVTIRDGHYEQTLRVVPVNATTDMHEGFDIAFTMSASGPGLPPGVIAELREQPAVGAVLTLAGGEQQRLDMVTVRGLSYSMDGWEAELRGSAFVPFDRPRIITKPEWSR